MRARVGDQSEVERQIVDGGYLHGQQLLGLEEVVQIGFRVDAVYADFTPRMSRTR